MREENITMDAADQPKEDMGIFFKTLLEHMDAGILLADIKDGQAEVKYLNPRFVETVKRTGADIGVKGENLMAAVHPDYLPGLLAATQASAKDRTPLDYTFKVYSRRGPGIYAWQHIRGVILPGDFDGAVRLLAVITDITKLMQSEEKLLTAEVKYKTVLEQIDSMIYEIDLRRDTLCYTGVMARRLGIEGVVWKNVRAELPFPKIVAQESRDELRSLVEDVYEGREGRRDYYIYGQDTGGVKFLTRNRYRLLKESSGRPYMAVGIVLPVQGSLIERIVDVDYDLFGLIDAGTGLMTHHHDNTGQSPIKISSGSDYQTVVKQIVEKMLPEELQAEGLEKLSLPQVIAGVNQNKVYIVTYPVKDALGQPAFKQWRYAWLDERKVLLAYTRSDVTEEYKYSKDLLTGLYARRTFVSAVERLVRGKPSGRFVMLCIDVNNFKIINDRFGHVEGDKVLQGVGRSIWKNILSLGGVACRDVADIFLAVCPNDRLVLADLPARLQADLPCLKDGESTVKLRFGLYEIKNPELDVNLMIDRAMLAQRSIKERTDVQLAVYDEAMRQELLWRQEVASELETALAEGQFKVWFQPQYDFDTGKLIGAEALVRWQHPKYGLLSPGRFIPILESNGGVSRLDAYVWEEACRYLSSWRQQEALPKITVSVNISRVDIYDQNLGPKLLALVKKYQLTPELLHLEITESVYVQNPQVLITAVENLRQLGFFVEMDDFGSGYSSLNMLKEVPVDLLKLDMCFLSKGKEERGGNIVSSILHMAHWLKLPVIAEGVETKVQADYLKSLNCIYMQGYYFARPMPAEAFQALLQKSLAGQVDTYEGVNLEGVGAFWDPSAQTALIFNSYVGGAILLEYTKDQVEIVRANDNFFRELHTTRSSNYAQGLKGLETFAPEGRLAFIAMLEGAIASGRETECLVQDIGAGDGTQEVWTHNRARLLARNGSSYLFYIAVENFTERVLLERNLRATSEELRRAVVKLETENERNRLLIENMGIGIFDYDVITDSLHIETNIQGQGVLRRDIPHYYDYLLRTKLVPPDSAGALRVLIKEAALKPVSSTLVYQANIWGSGLCWNRLVYESLADKDGKVYRIVGHVYSIGSKPQKLMAAQGANSRI